MGTKCWWEWNPSVMTSVTCPSACGADVLGYPLSPVFEIPLIKAITKQ